MDFLKSILYYLMDEVIEPNWLEFFKDMKRVLSTKAFFIYQFVDEAKTVDEVINMHSEFLDKVTTEYKYKYECIINRELLKCFIDELYRIAK